MFEKQNEEKNDDVIVKFREAFIFESAWELESNLEGTSVGNSPYRHVKAATVIFNKALDRTDYAGRIDLFVSMDDVENKRQEVWGQAEKQGYVASDSEVLQN